MDNLATEKYNDFISSSNVSTTPFIDSTLKISCGSDDQSCTFVVKIHKGTSNLTQHKVLYCFFFCDKPKPNVSSEEHPFSHIELHSDEVLSHGVVVVDNKVTKALVEAIKLSDEELETSYGCNPSYYRSFLLNFLDTLWV